MQRISNSVKQRLGARPQPQTHPEPDVLNAYLERVLPAAERNAVVRHLAECSYCREVASLSLPQVQAEPALEAGFSWSRFWVPAFRLGAALAVLAVAATMMIEKPWQTGPAGQPHSSQFVQPAPVGAEPQSPSAVVSTPTPAAPVATTSSENAPLRASTTGSLRDEEAHVRGENTRGAALPRSADKTTEAAPAPQPLGAVAGMPATSSLRALESPAPSRVTMARQAPATVDGRNKNDAQLSGQDYLNTNVLPSAPAPQRSSMRSTTFPAVSMDEAGNYAFDVNLVPPTTTQGTASGPADANTLRSSSGFMKGTRKVVVVPLEKAGKAAGGAARYAYKSFAGPYLKPLDVPGSGFDNLSDTKAATIPQWKISDGTLMKSTDSTQWHEAYPQSSDLQLKIVVPREGDQVWAGGNNGTIIHSWDGGVDWETLKVPDSGDITSIKVDDGWQVRTSNGQTFVSQDHGKTWTPLETQPK